jgi:Flp pilus assembly protein TadG
MMPLSRFLRDPTGSATVEFVAIALPFFLIVLFVMEVTLAFFWWKSAEKATMLGARLAAVQDVAATGMPARNEKRTDAAIFGKYCRDASNPCAADPGDTWVCMADGSSCNVPAKANVVAKMQSILAVIEPENVAIAYEFTGLGYAGGPMIPAVTVTLTGLQFQTGILSIIGGVLGGPALTTLPDITATVTGEDLSSAAAGA